MNKFTLILAALLGSTAFAANENVGVFVHVVKCDSGSEDTASTSMQAGDSYVVRASGLAEAVVKRSQTTTKGTLKTETRLVNVDGQQRIHITARFTSADSNAKGAGELNTVFGASALSRSGACEAPEDVGSMIVTVSTKTRK